MTNGNETEGEDDDLRRGLPNNQPANQLRSHCQPNKQPTNQTTKTANQPPKQTQTTNQPTNQPPRAFRERVWTPPVGKRLRPGNLQLGVGPDGQVEVKPHGGARRRLERRRVAVDVDQPYSRVDPRLSDPTRDSRWVRQARPRANAGFATSCASPTTQSVRLCCKQPAYNTGVSNKHIFPNVHRMPRFNQKQLGAARRSRAALR